MAQNITHVWQIALIGAYGEALGTRSCKGTADDAKSMARSNRVDAYDADIKRVAVIIDGKRVPFAAHEVESFSIGIQG